MKQILGGGKRGQILVTGALIVSVIGLFGGLALIPVLSPSAGAQVADTLRPILGPQPVANMESASFWIQDHVNQFLSRLNGGKLQIALSQDPTSSSTAQTIPIHNGNGTLKGAASTPDNGVTAPPRIGWQAYGPVVNGQPVMAQALQTLDPNRAYAGVALVRIDLSKLQLHVMPGYQEPANTAAIQHAFPNLGMIPASDQGRLIAAFNGGFKAINGHYGMMVNGVTLLPPVPGIATIAIYRDGHVQIGAWGQGIVPSADMTAYRQNCPLILQNGQLNPEVLVDDRTVWGRTVGNQSVTWRTAIGITKDGRYLIYAVGNASTVDTLAQALQNAGAYNAMQLDINRPFAHFVTYRPVSARNTSLSAVELLSQMENNDPTIYLTAHSRDFFYLTAR